VLAAHIPDLHPGIGFVEVAESKFAFLSENGGHAMTILRRPRRIALCLVVYSAIATLAQAAANPAKGMPDPPEGFPWKSSHLQVVAFIGTVTAFETPVYGLTIDNLPVSIVHVDVDKYLTGSWKPTEFVSTAAAYFSEKDDQIVFQMGSSPSAVFLKPGMRIVAIAWRRPSDMDRDRNIDRYGERFRLSFVREIGGSTRASGRMAHELLRPRLGAMAQMQDLGMSKSGRIPAEQLAIERQHETLTLEEVVDLVEKYYNSQGGTEN